MAATSLNPLQAMTAKEIALKGSFRFHEEFAVAVKLMQAGRLNLKQLVTHAFPLSEAVPAFQLASNRNEAIKIQLTFGTQG